MDDFGYNIPLLTIKDGRGGASELPCSQILISLRQPNSVGGALVCVPAINHPSPMCGFLVSYSPKDDPSLSLLSFAWLTMLSWLHATNWYLYFYLGRHNQGYLNTSPIHSLAFLISIVDDPMVICTSVVMHF